MAAVRLYARAAVCAMFAGLAARTANRRAVLKHDEHIVDGLAIVAVVLSVLRWRCLRSCSMSIHVSGKAANGRIWAVVTAPQNGVEAGLIRSGTPASSMLSGCTESYFQSKHSYIIDCCDGAVSSFSAPLQHLLLLDLYTIWRFHQSIDMAGSRNPYRAIADAELCSEAFARKEDEKDALSKLRKEFVIPTKGDLKNKKYGFQRRAEGASYNGHAATQNDDAEESIYFCGNSLGLQPRSTRDYVNRYLDTWASKGVFGHFTDYEGGLPPWLHLDDATKQQTAKIVGALPSEVVVMETLTANLHLLISSFYRPTADRWKIIIEGKAFPSDHVSA